MNLFQRLKNVFTNHLVDAKTTPAPQPPLEEFGLHIEWDKIGTPFCIERTSDGDDNRRETTSIGYWPPGGPNDKITEPLEWFLDISKEQHEKLVADFKLWLGKIT